MTARGLGGLACRCVGRVLCWEHHGPRWPPRTQGGQLRGDRCHLKYGPWPRIFKHAHMGDMKARTPMSILPERHDMDSAALCRRHRSKRGKAWAGVEATGAGNSLCAGAVLDQLPQRFEALAGHGLVQVPHLRRAAMLASSQTQRFRYPHESHSRSSTHSVNSRCWAGKPAC